VLNKEIDEISNKIKEIANDNEDAKLLMSIPGISFYSALFIISEIGDINRFPDSGHLVSYLTCSGKGCLCLPAFF